MTTACGNATWYWWDCVGAGNCGYMGAGDFWHVRGSLPVGPLNRVLEEFRNWRQPTLMLVGNHDQVPLLNICLLSPGLQGRPRLSTTVPPGTSMDARQCYSSKNIV